MSGGAKTQRAGVWWGPLRRRRTAAPRRQGCAGCEYRVVCGPYEEERVQGKPQAELSELREMRSWR